MIHDAIVPNLKQISKSHCRRGKCFIFFFFFFFLKVFFFFLKLFTYRSLFYKLKFTNKRKIKICHPIFQSLRLMKNNPFCLLPRLKNLPSNSHPQPPDLKAESDKMSKNFGLQKHFQLAAIFSCK